MIKELWSTGIILKWRHDRWFATCEYQSFTIGDMDNDVSGTLSAKYGFADPLTPVKIIIENAAQMGIDFVAVNKAACIYAEQDGEGVDMPDGWRETMHEVAQAVGFVAPYKLQDAEPTTCPHGYALDGGIPCTACDWLEAGDNKFDWDGER